MSPNSIPENLRAIQDRIAKAARHAGRQAEEITLIGVSKTHPAEAISQAYEAGVRHFGENRVQEWEAKRGAVADLAATIHLVGHLQSNKSTRAAQFFDSVDSVDDAALAQRLDRARQAAKKLRVLIEVRLATEESKSGVDPGEVPRLAEDVVQKANLELAGLMCIPPYLESAEEMRPYFRRLRDLHHDLEARLGRKLPVLSMGMSHDFEVAIEEGATEVRIGTALFGARQVTG
jgi:hypothetical protein